MSKVDLPWKDMNTITVLRIRLESDRPYQHEPNIQMGKPGTTTTTVQYKQQRKQQNGNKKGL